MPSQHRFLILLAYLSMLCLALADSVRGPLFPDVLREFAVSDVTGAWFFAVTSVTSLIAGFASQYAIVAMGRMHFGRMSLLILAASQFGMAVTTSFAWLLFHSFLLGLALGFVGVLQNVLVMRATVPSRLQQTQSGLHSIYGLSSFAAPLLVSAASHWLGGWRMTFWVSGAVALLALIPYLRAKDSEENLALTSTEPTLSSPSFRAGEALFYSSILGLYVAFELLVSTRLALLLRREHGYSLEQASFVTAAFFFFLFAGRVLFIFWRPGLTLAAQMRLSVVGAMVLAAVGILVHPWAFALVGLAMAPFYPLAMTTAGRLFSRQLDQVTSYCIAMAGVAVVLMHFLVGWITQSFEVSVAFWLGPAMGVVILFGLAVYSKIYQRELP